MTEITNVILKLSPRPLRFSHTEITAPAGNFAPLVGGDLVYTAFFQNPAETANTTDPITVPFNQAIQVQGVALDVSTIEGFWKRPGFEDEWTSLGQLTDLTGGNWEVAVGFEAVIFESGTDHGSAPWTDIDFKAKLISPQGVSWTDTIDVNISHSLPGVPASSTIDPTFESDCLTVQAAIAYGMASTEAAALSWVANCCDPKGTIEFRYDYEGDWATGLETFFWGTYGGGHNLKIFTGGAGDIIVRSDSASDTFNAVLTHGLADAARKQIRIVVNVHDVPPTAKIYVRDAGQSVRDDTGGWGTVVDTQSDGADNGRLDEDITTFSVGLGTAGTPTLLGVMREFFIALDREENLGTFDQAVSHWRLDNSAFSGIFDSLDDDEEALEFQLKIVGGAGFSVCWQA